MVERYDYCGPHEGHVELVMKPRDRGLFVLHESYAELESENAELRERVGAMESAALEVIDTCCVPDLNRTGVYCDECERESEQGHESDCSIGNLRATLGDGA